MPDGIGLRFVPTDQAMDSFCYEGPMAGITEGVPLPVSTADDNVTANVDTGTLEASQIMPAASSVQIRCVLTNPSSSVESHAVTLSTCACFTCPADFNFDGGVDGADVDVFFAAWGAGGC